MAALLSFLCPGLGQLIQGRLLAALAFFFGVPLLYAGCVLTMLAMEVNPILAILFGIVPGFTAQIYCIMDAAQATRNQYVSDMQRAIRTSR